MRMYEQTIEQILHAVQLSAIRASSSCSAQSFLPDVDYPYRERVSEFRYTIRGVRELLAQVEKELQYAEQDVDSVFEDANIIKGNYLRGELK